MDVEKQIKESIEVLTKENNSRNTMENIFNLVNEENEKNNIELIHISSFKDAFRNLEDSGVIVKSIELDSQCYSLNDVVQDSITVSQIDISTNPANGNISSRSSTLNSDNFINRTNEENNKLIDELIKTNDFLKMEMKSKDEMFMMMINNNNQNTDLIFLREELKERNQTISKLLRLLKKIVISLTILIVILYILQRKIWWTVIK